MRFRLVVACLLCFFSSAANSQDVLPWLAQSITKAEDKNTLSYFTLAGDICTFDQDALDAVVEGVFIRGRIKPDSNGWTIGDLYLQVVATCVDVTVGGTKKGVAIDISIYFGKITSDAHILYDYNFGDVITRATASDPLLDIQKHVEKALTTYLQVNFDLTPD